MLDMQLPIGFLEFSAWQIIPAIGIILLIVFYMWYRKKQM